MSVSQFQNFQKDKFSNFIPRGLKNDIFGTKTNKYMTGIQFDI